MNGDDYKRLFDKIKKLVQYNSFEMRRELDWILQQERKITGYDSEDEGENLFMPSVV